MGSSAIKIAVVQMQSIDSVQSNLKSILKICSQVDKGVELVFFPENALYMRIIEGESINPIKLDGKEIQELNSFCKKLGLTVFLGSVAVQNGNSGKLKNATILLRPDMAPKIAYEKIHLFDIQLQGQRPIRESDVFENGQASAVESVNGWSFGLSICYDLRFSDLFSDYARQAVDVIAVPSAFLKGTGRDHWEVLLRARAIESQCYVVAAAQAGVHVSSTQERCRETYGHSMVIDPWGNIIGQLDGVSPGILEVELTREAIQKVRNQIPMKDHRQDIKK